MSGKISGLCWDLDLPHNQLIVLLAMADHADHDGNNVFPSLRLVSWKTGYSEQTCRRAIKKLVEYKILIQYKSEGYTDLYSIRAQNGKQKTPLPHKIQGSAR